MEKEFFKECDILSEKAKKLGLTISFGNNMILNKFFLRIYKDDTAICTMFSLEQVSKYLDVYSREPIMDIDATLEFTGKYLD